MSGSNSNSLKNRFIFFGRNSSLHGLRFIFRENPHLFTRVFWSATLCLSAGCLGVFLAPASRPGAAVGFTPDTRYLRWSTAFPAVTVCERYVLKLAQQRFTAFFPEVMQPLDFTTRKHFTDIMFARGACSRSLCAPCGGGAGQVACDLPWRDMADRVRKSCEEMLQSCFYNGEEFSCCEQFRPVDSESGLCFAFNSLQTRDGKTGERRLYTVNRTTGPTFLQFHLLADALVITTYVHVVSLHSAEELATSALDPNLQVDVSGLSENAVELLFAAVAMDNEPALRDAAVRARGCRFPDEVTGASMDVYPVYSHAACRLARDTALAHAHCGCVHPVRDREFEDYYCNFTGINCLLKFDVEKNVKSPYDFDVDSDELCEPSCVESQLKTIHVSKRWSRRGPAAGTAVTVRMAALPTLRYRRNVLRTDLDLVVSVGGVVGLFFGASILCLVEVFYLILRKPSKNYK